MLSKVDMETLRMVPTSVSTIIDILDRIWEQCFDDDDTTAPGTALANALACLVMANDWLGICLRTGEQERATELESIDRDNYNRVLQMRRNDSDDPNRAG